MSREFSSLWLMGHLSRQQASKNHPVITPDAVTRESDLHDQIFDYCRQRGWIALHGSMAERTHRTAGEEDFIIRANGGRVFFIELKSKFGKLSPAQLAMHTHAAHLGHKSFVVRSFQEFLAIVK